MVTLSKRLNLVVPVERDDGSTLYIHSMPIGAEIFQRYYLVLSKTFAELYKEGLSVVAGPRIAAMMLRDIATRLGQDQDIENGLIQEIKRLSNVLVLTDSGWRPTMLDQALGKGLVHPDEWSEAEGAIVFFIVASAMHKRTDLPSILGGLSQLWGAQVSSLNCMEYAASLRTSTEVADTTKPRTKIPV